MSCLKVKTIDFKQKRRKKRNENLEKTYLVAEQLINEIKAEYLKMLKGISKDDSVYQQLTKKLDSLKFDLTDYWFYQFKDRLNMSLLAIDAVYENTEELRKEAKEAFGLEMEVLTLLELKNWKEDFKFREEYLKEVELEKNDLL